MIFCEAGKKVRKLVVASNEPNKFLFSNKNLLTGETLNINYKQLAKCFHPNKWSQDENQELANRIFKIILTCKEGFEKNER